jgi:hypothetical protein
MSREQRTALRRAGHKHARDAYRKKRSAERSASHIPGYDALIAFLAQSIKDREAEEEAELRRVSREDHLP